MAGNMKNGKKLKKSLEETIGGKLTEGLEIPLVFDQKPMKKSRRKK